MLSRRDAAAGQVDAQLAELDHGVGARAVDGPAQHRAHARQQLVDPERLGHVVVGSGVERLHLLALVADGRDEQDGDVRPGADLARDVVARAVRQQQVEQHEVGRLERDLRERVGARPHDVHVVAGGLERGLERALDGALVVDDQHPCAASAHARTSSLTFMAGSTMRMHVPPPGASSIVSVPALASTKPRAIASPRPVPPAPPPRPR